MSRLTFEASSATPLCWFTAAVPRGATNDPNQLPGLTRHAAELARRGAGSLDRTALEAAIDGLGGSVDVEVDRDWLAISGTSLARNFEKTVDLAAQILSAPRFAEEEHQALVRETKSDLDDIRDDDGSLAERHFLRLISPGHPYARTTIGTEESVDAIEPGMIPDHHRRLWVRDEMLVGISGALGQADAERLQGKLIAAAPGTPSPTAEQSAPPMSAGRRIYVIDKPERNQCQILIGHGAPRYGTDDFIKLMPLETALGGMFSSRLMQEIRVKRGWSYGAGCRMMRAKHAHWFRMSLAPTSEVAVSALSLTLEIYREIADKGVTEEELKFAVAHIRGGLPFQRATARQRMRGAIRHRVIGLPTELPETIGQALDQVTVEQVREVARRCLTPDDLCITIVATADQIVPDLEAAGLAPTEIVAYDSY